MTLGGQVHVPPCRGERTAGDTITQAEQNLQVQGLRPQGVQEAAAPLRHRRGTYAHTNEESVVL